MFPVLVQEAAGAFAGRGKHESCERGPGLEGAPASETGVSIGRARIFRGGTLRRQKIC